ncbi:MAG: DEAD/DEAH box helicase family protein [Acidobacteriota bacterium]|nr:DEAD/DEAH box helicase family protein [Acidobacteriota bacterium]
MDIPATTTTRRVRASRRNGTAAPLKFDRRLILTQWMLSLFEVDGFDKLADALKDQELEGFDADNISLFHYRLATRHFERREISAQQLLEYDQNIVRHWQAITGRRNLTGHLLHPKYFQYLALLFAEIYLDRYFSDPDRLLASLNKYVAAFNSERPQADQIEPYEPTQLNKLAFWNATGSGKTLLMHVNVNQYKHYLAAHGRQRELNRVLLLTPNEGLSSQHLKEFADSGIQAELFVKEGRGLFSGHSVEVIDIHKLKDEMGEKTVAVDAFEGNNLVLVDEGHRGSSGEEWKSKRDRLCENGFSFEYSATFGQAIKAANKKELTQEYAKCIIFDYSYKYFYRDGYGKDYQILNLEDDSKEEVRDQYLTACFLVFYQQLRLYLDQRDTFRPFLIEHPLWVFVGGSVNAVRMQNGRKVSDVLSILLFLADFVRERQETVHRIGRLLTGHAGLRDTNNRELFDGAFTYLIAQGSRPEEIYEDILRAVFNAPAQAALHVENLKGTEGEIALRLGENPPFGVINVGDAASLCKLGEEHRELLVTEREFSGSLFRGINDDATTVNVLIGSKKFTEGWNSWRVSTMGLMNIGRSEGSEIIQLFGRGVRLKGHDFSLKRSNRLEGVRAPRHITTLETLNIFGIRANYMRQFKEYLAEEGLPANEHRVEVRLPILNNLGTKKLRMIRLKEGIDFKRNGPKPTLSLLNEHLARHPVTVDWYPKIQAERSSGLKSSAGVAAKDECQLTPQHVAFMDGDAIFFELERFKNERAWHNLNLPRDSVRELLASPDWYRLYIPKEELAFDNFGKVRLWQEVAAALLKKYCDRYYKYRKNEYEMPHLEYRDLSAGDPNFFDDYRFLVDESRQDIIETLEQLKGIISRRELRDVEMANLQAFFFGQHLYEPLIHLNSDLVELRPVNLNEGERDFVLDLRSFYQNNRKFFEGRELYLLRNMSRGRGVGFFEAGNFYPDFILWLVADNRQHVTFVDPKGIRNLQGEDDPKIRFHRTVKELEARLGDPKITLNSFILSNTPYQQVSWWGGGMTLADFEARHVLFTKPAGGSYIQKMMEAALAASTTGC